MKSGLTVSMMVVCLFVLASATLECAGTDYTTLNNLIVNAGPEPAELEAGGTYVIDQSIIHTLTTDLVINGNGATILLDTSSDVEHALYFKTSTGTSGGSYNLTIRDVFIDANQNAYRGLHVRNEENTTLKNVELVDVRVENAYRSGTAFQGGDGIFVRGGFDRVNMINPIIKNITLASGAGISGSEGVFGITVTRNYAGTLGAKHVVVDNPHIENITSEDNTYHEDQDGIRLIGLDPSTTEIFEGSSKIMGGVFKNCWGRSIKIQRNDCVVMGARFYRDTGFSSGYGNGEIDFQYGSGQVSNIYCHYDSFNPTVIVSSTSGSKKQSGFSVDGINATLKNTALTCAVQRYRGGTPQQGTPMYVKNVSIEGSTDYMIQYDTNVGTDTDPSQYCVAENCYADDITEAFLRIRGDSNTNQVVIRNCADRSNTGTPLIEENIYGNVAFAEVLASGNSGLTGGDSAGSWTAHIEFGGASAGVGYVTRLGNYTRVNNYVTCTLFLLLSNKGTSTGNVTITGLPFDIANDSKSYSAASIGSMRNITFSGQMQVWGEINTDRLNLGQTTESGVYSSLNHANFKNNSELILTFSYCTDEK